MVINEFMAVNNKTLPDPEAPDESPDWIEIYNSTDGTVNLGGMYLSDSMQDLTRWQIAAGISIGPGQFMVFYADDNGLRGLWHTNFKLSGSGEVIALVDSDGKTILDAVMFDTQFEDVSYGRYPDGGEAWGFQQGPTPGLPNQMPDP